MSEETKRHGVGRIGFEGCFKQCMCGQKFNDWNEFNAHIDGVFKELEANTPERTDERQAEIEAVLLDRIQILTQQEAERGLPDYAELQERYKAVCAMVKSGEEARDAYFSHVRTLAELRAQDDNQYKAEMQAMRDDRDALIRLNARLLDEADALRREIEQIREDY